MPVTRPDVENFLGEDAPEAHRELLERFQVRRELGRGGMGVVYLGTLPGTDTPCALKTLRVKASSSAARRLLREATVLSKTMHPHLVDFLDSGMADDLPWVALEYVEGETLKELIRYEHPFEDDFVEELMHAMASVLEILHGIDLVHRDVKPSNIMITEDERVVLMDLGLALPGGMKRLTEDGMVVGTASYLAPEYIQEGISGPAQDWYALGCCLYETLVGKPPFTSQAILQEALGGDWPPLPEIHPGYGNPRLRELARRLTDEDPELRLHTQEQVLGVLGEEPYIEPASVSQPLPAPVREPAPEPEPVPEARLRDLSEEDEGPLPGAGVAVVLLLLLAALALAVVTMPAG